MGPERGERERRSLTLEFWVVLLGIVLAVAPGKARARWTLPG